MDESKNLKLGVLFSYINTIAGFVVAILYTPFMLRCLGQQQYGLYNMGQAAVSYLSLTEFGFGNAVVRYASKYRAEGNEEKTAGLYGVFMYIYLILAAIVFVVGMILVVFVDRFYKVSTGAEGYTQLRTIMTIMVVGLSFTFATTVYNSIIQSYERFTFLKVTNLIYTLAKPLTMIPLLTWGYKAITLSVVSLVLTAALHIGNIIYVNAKLKVRICMKFRQLDFSIMGEILRYSFFIFLGTIVAQLNDNADSIILGSLIGETAVAVYAIGYTLNTYILQIPGIITSVFFPRVTMLVTKGATMEELTKLMTKIGRIQLYLALLTCSGFSIFGGTFVKLWAGEGYEVAYWIVLVISIPGIIPTIQSIPLQIIQAMNRHQFKAILYVVSAVLNVAFSIPAGILFGPLGCAVCTGVTSLLTKGIIINWFYAKKIGLNIREFWNNILLVLVKIIPIFIGGALVVKLTNPQGWVFLSGEIVLYTLAYCGYLYIVCMDANEKEECNSIMRKIGLVK